ncbi:WxL domain-containing protein [Carnobacterium gallinarum]|uniref:WxL domain-containing protein n=1 Tax=Carnobacterium gallinarum TaxID=2749 RepID=UPI0005579894|nr:WxL domain-containing protein [Carnobacterium gallinarum]
MSKFKAISLITLGSVLVLGTATTALAAPDPATSTNKIEFESGAATPTDPLDPTNPDNTGTKPVDPSDPNNNGTGNNGPLSIDFVSNIDFGTKKVSPKTEVYNALNENPYVQVTDTTGEGKGWTLTAAASTFADSTGNKVLKGAELSFLNGQVKTVSTNVSDAPVANQSLVFSNTDSKEVLKADVNAGKGSWVNVWSGTKDNNSNVTLKVLAGSAEKAAYTSKVTWTLVAGPTAP